MEVSKSNKQIIWNIKISSKYNLADEDRDFIADIISEEDRKTFEPYHFILHEIIESKRHCEIFIESTETALENLLSVIKDNVLCKITYKRHML